MEDKDVPKNKWNRYMKKYMDKYRPFYAEDKIWKLRCKYGHVELFSLKNQRLCFYGDFLSPMRKTYFYRKLPPFVEIMQDGYTECVCVFPEEKIDSVAKALNLYKKRKISEEGKEILIEKLKKAREAKQNGNNK